MPKDIIIQKVPKEHSLRNLPEHFTMKDRLFIEKIVKENYREGFLNGQGFKVKQEKQ